MKTGRSSPGRTSRLRSWGVSSAPRPHDRHPLVSVEPQVVEGAVDGGDRGAVVLRGEADALDAAAHHQILARPDGPRVVGARYEGAVGVVALDPGLRGRRAETFQRLQGGRLDADPAPGGVEGGLQRAGAGVV